MADYCTLADVMAAPDLPAATDQGRITQAISAASRMVDRYLGVEDDYYAAGTSPGDDETRYYDADGTDELWLNDQLISITSISIDEDGDETWTALASADYWTWPSNSSPKIRIDINPNGDYTAWPAGKRRVKIVGLFGIFATVPATIKEATMIQAIRLYRAGQQAFEDGARRDSGQAIYNLDLHPMTKRLLEDIPVYNEII